MRRACTQPIPGTAPGPRRARLERTGILHVLQLHGLQSLAWQRRRPLCWNVREPTHVWAPECPRQSSSSPAALSPAAFQASPFLRQDPRRASYIRYHSPCFQGRVPVFWFKQMGVILEVGREKEMAALFCIYGLDWPRWHDSTMIPAAHTSSVSLCLATIPSPDSWKFILIAQAAQPTCDSVGAAAAACTWRRPPSRYKSGSNTWAVHTRGVQYPGPLRIMCMLMPSLPFS